MTPEIQEIADTLLGPLVSALTGIEGVMLATWGSLVAIMVSAAALMSGAGLGSGLGPLANRVISCLLTGVLAIIPVRYAQAIIDWSVNQARTWAGLAGAEASVTPLEIATSGMSMFTRATDHADVIVSYLDPSTWLMPLVLVIAGFVILFAYIILTFFVISCWIEIYACALLLFPLFVFTTIAGFGGAGLSGIGFMMSATVRLAAYAFIATAGAILVTNPEFGIPPVGEAVTWLQTAIAVMLAVALLFFAMRMNGLISGVLMGRPGWSAPVSTVMSAISTAGSAAWTGVTGGSAAAGAARGGGGGGSSGAGAGGGSAGATVHTTRTPINSRSARA